MNIKSKENRKNEYDINSNKNMGELHLTTDCFLDKTGTLTK